MQELILKWLPLFALIIGGICLLPNIFIGLLRSLGDVLGYSNEWLLEDDDSLLEIFLQLFFSGGLFSVISGVFWIFLVHQKIASESSMSDVLVIGGILGLVIFGVGKMLVPNWEVFNLRASLVGGLSGGIGGGFFGLLNGIIGKEWKIGIAGVFFSMIMCGVGSGGAKKNDKRWTLGSVAVATFVIGMLIGMLFDAGLIVILIILGDEFAFPITLGLAGGIVFILLPLAEMTARIGTWVIGPVFILLKFKPTLCSHCLRNTIPLKSRYRDGIRYCEHCQQAVEHTKERGEVIFTFGYPLEAKGRQFILSTPDFEYKNHPIDVAKIYIETSTCDKRLLERFLTYIVNYPPMQGLHSVQVFYRGMLDELGENLKNALQNTFRHVERIH